MIPIDFAGKTVLVTGGTRGIGRGISRLFAEAGASTIAIYRSNEESARVSLTEREAHGGIHRNYRCDVSQEAEVSALCSQVLADVDGKIDFLVLNSARIPGGASIQDTSLSDWHTTMDNNLTSAFLLTRAFLPHVPRGGAVVGVASGAGHLGLPGLSVYGASKAGLILFCEALAQDYGPKGIRVNVVSPGSTDSSYQGDPSADEAEPRSSKDNALRRGGTPLDVARAVLFFCSDLSGFVTGQWLRVNGGVV